MVMMVEVLRPIQHMPMQTYPWPFRCICAVNDD